MSQEHLELVLPEGAADRGHLVRGEISSANVRVPDVLVQFSRLSPHKRRASLYIYANLEQAKILFAQAPPFSFKGATELDDQLVQDYYADEIWLNYGSEMSLRGMRCFTQPSGTLSNLQISNRVPNHSPAQNPGVAWFVASRCFALECLASPAEEERRANSSHLEYPPFKVSLSGGSVAEIKHLVIPKRKGEKRITTSAYAIQVDDVRDSEAVYRDVSGLLILASFISLERSDFTYWSVRTPEGINSQKWRFGIDRWPARLKGVKPLVQYLDCGEFLRRAVQTYLGWIDGSSFDSAVFALLSRELPIESNIVSLHSGLQRVLALATGTPSAAKLSVEKLFVAFQKNYPIDLGDLWPLFGGEASINRIRNVLVHGRAFTSTPEFKALMIATENLRWILERIMLTALGWDVSSSTVSRDALKFHTAHDWRGAQKQLIL